MGRQIRACYIVIVLAIVITLVTSAPLAKAAASTQAATEPSASGIASTQPGVMVAVPGGPTSVLHALLRSIDHGDRKQALACFAATTPLEISAAGAQVDMMLAVARLKKAMRDKIGPIDPYALQMAVVGEGECASIGESINGDSATVTAKSNDDATWGTDYDMVRVRGVWKLSLATAMDSIPKNVPPGAELAMTNSLIKAVNDTAGAVERGELKNADAVNQRIEQSVGGMGLH